MNRPKTVVRWSPHDPNLFAVGSEDIRVLESVTRRSDDHNAELLGTQRSRSFRLVHVDSEVPQLKCMEWYPHSGNPMMIAAGLGSGRVLLTNFQGQASKDRVSQEFIPKYSRPCNSISWNPHNPSQLAVGLEKVRSDFCTLVWDVNIIKSVGVNTVLPANVGLPTRGPNSHRVHIGESVHGIRDRGVKPVHELSNSEATVAVSWVPSQPSCLATGTGFKWLRIYDLRGNSTAPLSVIAHTKAVHGVVFDIHRPNVLATYSIGPQEVVKVWDIRKIDNPTGPLATLTPSTRSLSEIAWSPSKAGILATTSTEDKWISLWDISKCEEDTSISKPFKRRYTSNPIVSFSWRYVSSSNLECDSNQDALFAAAFPNRILTATTSGEVEDISLHDSMPVTISPFGCLSFACGKLLFGEPLQNTDLSDNDIAFEMMKLAKNGYALEVRRILELLETHKQNSLPGSWRYRQLSAAWSWIYQVEKLSAEKVRQIAQSGGLVHGSNINTLMAPVSLRGWPIDCVLLFTGVKNLLESGSNDGEYEFTISDMRVEPLLGCKVYEGPGRRLAMLVCQWDPDMGPSKRSKSNKPFSLSSLSQYLDSDASYEEYGNFDLGSICQKYISIGCYDKSAALYVFHGDLKSSISILQQGADHLQNQLDKFPQSSSRSNILDFKTIALNAEAMRLVSMAIVGYTTAVTQDSRVGGSHSLWVEMCQQLIHRPQIENPGGPRYLHAICTFLLATHPKHGSTRSASRQTRRGWGSNEISNPSRNSSGTLKAYAAILNDQSLPLNDRVAFACRFLSETDLKRYILDVCREGEKNGSLEGLLLTGLNDEGINLLQSYLDITGDVQTVGLLVLRLPDNVLQNLTLACRWIDTYKKLLNKWQLWHERALLDVGRAKMEERRLEQQKVLQTHTSITDAISQTVQGNPPKDTLFKVPPQLYVRCNFCGVSLSLSNMLRLGGSHASWLNRAKPKLTCCPSCRKPLPQCSLCLLPLGSLNPYFELAQRRAKQRSENNISSNSLADSKSLIGGNMSDLSSIPFAEWFTWCQTCRHGGHSHHMSEWFRKHEICPVSECDCKCNSLDKPAFASNALSRILGSQE